MRKVGFRILVFCIALNLSIVTVFAGTHRVTETGAGDSFSSVSDAVAAADSGDTIQVAEGTYVETVILDKSLILQGGWDEDFSERNEETHLTTIDADGEGPVIQVGGGHDVTIEGFEIINGDASGSFGWGGGILVFEPDMEASYVLIQNNTIRSNVANPPTGAGRGGGIMVTYSNVQIIDNKIFNNVAQLNSGLGGEGGGIYLGPYCIGTVERNEIYNNQAAADPGVGHSGMGGGIYCENEDIHIIDNNIHNNIAAVDGLGKGGGIYGDGYIYNNLIESNRASIHKTGAGGGVYSATDSSILYNIIDENIASVNQKGNGGGIYVYQHFYAAFNQITKNSATRGGGMYLTQYSRGLAQYNEVRNNEATGTDEGSEDHGGGIWTGGNEIDIWKNDIRENSSKLDGGGIYVTGSTDCEIKKNFILANEARMGGGIRIHSSGKDIYKNEIVSNKSKAGGGIYVTGNRAPQIDANLIAANESTGNLGSCGAGMLVDLFASSKITLTNNIICKNKAGIGKGGGILVTGGACRMFNCNVVDNNTGTNKDGIYLLSTDGTHYLFNNIIYGHDTGVFLTAGGSLKADYNDYYQNVTDMTGATPGANHSEKDPFFESRAASDYHLKPGSALINNGKTTDETYYDFEGNSRPRGSEYDIGAYEYYPPVTYVSADSGSDETGTGASGNPYASISTAYYQTRVGGTVKVAEGRYPEHPWIGKDIQLKGGYGYPSWSRNLNKFTSVIDGLGTGTVVTVYGNDTHAVIDGFDITNGHAWTSEIFPGFGGGILVRGTATADIRNNRIYKNIADWTGGGICLIGSTPHSSTVSKNKIYHNQANANSVRESPAGGGISLREGVAYINNNMIYQNFSNGWGDGIEFITFWKENSRIVNNTIVDNDPHKGEGVYIAAQNSRPVFHNNLIVGHDTGILICEKTVVDHNYNGYYDNAYNIEGDVHAGNDVQGNPCFPARLEGNLQLRHCSAMLDKGNPDPDYFPDEDFQSDARPVNGRVDIGADEMIDSPPMIELLTPNPDNRACINRFEISWIDDDPEQDATVLIMYDDDPEFGPDLELIGSPTSEDHPGDSLEWNVEEMPEGIYWIYGVIDDEVNPTVWKYAPSPLIITRTDNHELADHILGRNPIPEARIYYCDLQGDGIVSSADVIEWFLLE